MENNKPLYFIDYDCDMVVPCSGTAHLVVDYCKAMAQCDMHVSVFDTFEEMMEVALDNSRYARHGSQPFERLDDKELTIKIIDAKILYHEEELEKLERERKKNG